MEATANRPRLNPFAFVSDTSFRFALIVLVVACADFRVWTAIGYDILDLFPIARACMQRVQPTTQFLWLSGGDFKCYRPLLVAPLPWVAVGLSILAAATALIYAAYPRWQIRRLGLQPLDLDELPNFARALDQLCQTAGLQRRPEFLWNPLNGHHAALAFGTRRNRRVGLTSADVFQFSEDPAAFRAMLLHELAHIRNGDVSITYLALSIWWAFLVTGVVPAVIIDFPRLTWLEFVLSTFNLTLYFLVILLSLKALLRARELYADARSVVWHQDSDGLARALNRLTPVPRWRLFFSPHPAPSRRQQLVATTDEMFRFGMWEAFGVGLASTFMLSPLLLLTAYLLGLLGQESKITGSVVWSLLLPLLILTMMIGGSVAVGTWRSTFLALAQDRRQPPTFRVALACAVGIMIGTGVYTIMSSALGAAGIGRSAGMTASLSVTLPTAIVTSVIFCLTIALALALVLMVLSKWIAAVARCWLGAKLLGDRPGPTFVLVLAISLSVWTFWFGSVLFSFAVGIFYFYQGKEPLAILVLIGSLSELFPFVWIGIVGFWLIPLAAALRPSRLPSNIFWLIPKGSAGAAPELPVAPIRLRRALLVGLIGGVAAILTASRMPISLTADALSGTYLPATDASARHVARLMTGELVASISAVAAVLVIPRLSILHAAFAAFVAGGLFCLADIYYLHSAHLRAPVLGTDTFMRNLAQTMQSGLADPGVLARSIFFSGTLMALALASLTYLLTRPVRWLVARLRPAEQSK